LLAPPNHSPAATVEPTFNQRQASATRRNDPAYFRLSADSRRDEIVAGAFYKTRGDKNNLPHIVGPLNTMTMGISAEGRVYDRWKWGYDGLANAEVRLTIATWWRGSIARPR